MRILFVLILILLGTVASLSGGPFHALLFYLWNAYFRPELWVWDPGLIQSLRLSFCIYVYLVATTLVFASDRLRLTGQLILLLCIPAHGLLSMLYSEYPDFAGEWLWAHFKTVCIAYLIAVLPRDSRDYRLVVMFMAFSLSLEGAKQGWASLILYPGAQNSGDIGNLQSHNDIAVALIMLSSYTLAIRKTFTNKWARRVCAFLTIGTLYRSVVTYSRGGFLSLIAFGLLHLRRFRSKWRVLLVTSILTAVILPTLPDSFWERMRSITAESEERDASARGRVHFWKTALDMAGENPFLGVGTYCFQRAYDDYDSSEGEFGSGRDAHSAWFGILSEAGYLGLALYCGLLAISIRNCRRVIRMSKERPDHEELSRFATFASAIQAALVAFMVGSTFTSIQYTEILWHTIGLALGLPLLTKRYAHEPARTEERSHPEPAPEPLVVEAPGHPG